MSISRQPFDILALIYNFQQEVLDKIFNDGNVIKQASICLDNIKNTDILSTMDEFDETHFAMCLREAQASSRIEGLFLNTRKLILHINDKDKSVCRNSLEVNDADDIQGKINTLYDLGDLDDLNKIKTPAKFKSLLLNIHKDIMVSDRSKEHCTPGKFRKVQVYVGNHICPRAEHINHAVSNLCDVINYGLKKEVNGDIEISKIIMAAVSHGLYELIHPFIDGNGRSGRVLVNYLLKGLANKYYINSLSNQINIRQQDYYQILNLIGDVVDNNKVKLWVKFTLGMIKFINNAALDDKIFISEFNDEYMNTDNTRMGYYRTEYNNVLIGDKLSNKHLIQYPSNDKLFINPTLINKAKPYKEINNDSEKMTTMTLGVSNEMHDIWDTGDL